MNSSLPACSAERLSFADHAAERMGEGLGVVLVALLPMFQFMADVRDKLLGRKEDDVEPNPSAMVDTTNQRSDSYLNSPRRGRA